MWHGKAAYGNLIVAIVIALMLGVSAPAERLLFGVIPRAGRPVAAVFFIFVPPMQLLVSGALILVRRRNLSRRSFWVLLATCLLSLLSTGLFWVLVIRWYFASIS